jgi:hypothetical protein
VTDHVNVAAASGTGPLTDSASLGQLCSYPGTLTFKVSGDAIFVPMGFTVDVTGPGNYPVAILVYQKQRQGRPSAWEPLTNTTNGSRFW